MRSAVLDCACFRSKPRESIGAWRTFYSTFFPTETVHWRPGPCHHLEKENRTQHSSNSSCTFAVRMFHCHARASNTYLKKNFKGHVLSVTRSMRLSTRQPRSTDDVMSEPLQLLPIINKSNYTRTNTIQPSHPVFLSHHSANHWWKLITNI